MNPCLLLLLVTLSTTLPLTLDLQPLLNLTQPPKLHNITLRPNEVYIHQSSYLEPQYPRAQFCQLHSGMLKEEKILTFPVVSREGKDGNGGVGGIGNLQYVYVQKYGIIYRLGHQSLQAYHFSQLEQKLSYIEKVQFMNSHCGAQLALTPDSENLYYFSCEKIIRIETKRTLSAIALTLELREAFYGHKVVSGDGFFVWASLSQGVRVYSTQHGPNITLVQTLQHFTSQTSTPQKISDLALSPSRLYLLGNSQTLFIYDQLGTGQFKSKINISLTSLCSANCKHRQLVVHQNSVYIHSVDGPEEFVAELQVLGRDGEVKGVGLVRYFKGKRSYIGMEVWNKKLLIAYKHAINLYEINRDPRTIERLLNGISNTHFQQLTHLTRISPNLFIKTTPTLTSVTRLSITKPSLQCQFPSAPHTSTFTLKQPCSLPQHTNPHRYYQSCLGYDIVSIIVQEPGKQHHIFAVAAVFLFCAAVLGVLVLWRKSKIELIETLVTEINKIKRRRGKGDERVEFVEEKHVTREVNWSEIEESVEKEEKEEKDKERDRSRDQGKEQEMKEIRRQEQKKLEKSAQRQKQRQKQEQKANKHIELQQEIEQDDQIQGTQRNMV